MLENTQKYIGVKFVNAKPMNLGDYNDFKGWTIPENEDPKTKGYIVQYPDSYISWCPEQQFIDANTLITEMPFGHAIEAIKKGFKVARKGWNGKDMYVFLVLGSVFKVNKPPLLGIYPEGTEINYDDHMDIKKADGHIGTWSPSNSDALAEDWFIVE